MRNLELLGHKSYRVTNKKPEGRSFIATDPESNTVYTAFNNSDFQVIVSANNSVPGDEHAFVEIGHWTAQNIVSFSYLTDLQAVCLSTSDGDIILFYKERFEKGEEALEVVGSVDSGISALSWSPDQDLVVLVTGEAKVLEMTQDFDAITEFELHVEEQGEGVHHTVGWGKKETQFHGSVGKEAAQQKVDASKFGIADDDDMRPRIAWRGDGNFFTISAVDPNKNARVIRVYNREGILQNTSEPVDKLEQALDWRPSGNLIVSTQKLPHRHDIVFFERNGLRHGEFTLREIKNNKQRVLEVLWNADSTVLAIWIESQVGDTIQKSVQLWTTKNYHWYMKQHVVLPGNGNITGFLWDIENAAIAHLFSSSGEYHCLKYTLEIFSSTSIDHSNSGYTAVTDGSMLLLTPFVYQNVPPPMSSLTFNAENNIQHVSFGYDNEGRTVAIITNDKIQLVELPLNGRGQTLILGEFDLCTLSDSNRPICASFIRQLRWIDENHIVYCQYDNEVNTDILCVAKFTLGKKDSIKVTSIPVESSIGRIYFNTTYKDLLFEDIRGSVYEISNLDGEPIITQIQVFPDFCPWIATGRVSSIQGETERVIVGLTERSKLYTGDSLVSSECTSFFVRGTWLVFSTTSNTARFLSFENTTLENLRLSDSVADAYDETSRRLERGSKIVIATQQKPSLILQMPRGNLETISPRAFVLATIREDLKNLNYRSAFVACRKNRIDLNILYDDSPERFMENIETFVKQVADVDYLNLFLSNLRNEDTLATMYRRGGQTLDQVVPAAGVENKVNHICEAVRTVLEELGREHYMQSIISTYVRSSPPDVESALALLSEIRETDLSAAEEALKYTVFLCKSDHLYKVALGMYNFPLVLMVAQQAQMDPKEYLPFLQELKNFEKYYQRYKIDDYLKRYEKALRNLSQAGDEHFDELLGYMKSHDLYLIAIEEYVNRPAQKTVILNTYGDYLSFRTSYEDAGIVYTTAGNKTQAIESYRMAGCWREAFSIAKQLKYSEEDIHALAYDMIEYLKEKRRFQEAASVAKDYVMDIEETVDCLLKGSLWKEAERVSYTFGREDLIETNVKSGLVEGLTQIEEDINEMSAQFHKQTARLTELRSKKTEQKIENHMANDESLDNIDMFSDTTSMHSQFTRYTNASSRVSSVSSQGSGRSRKTSKLRRKEERKRARGKKGTVFEEEYLINSLKKLYEKTNNMQTDIGSIIRALVPFGFIDEARSIQEKFEKFLQELELSLDIVFVPLQLAVSLYASLEEYEESQKEPLKPVEKPIMIKSDWKLQIL